MYDEIENCEAEHDHKCSEVWYSKESCKKNSKLVCENTEGSLWAQLASDEDVGEKTTRALFKKANRVAAKLGGKRVEFDDGSAVEFVNGAWRLA